MRVAEQSGSPASGLRVSIVHSFYASDVPSGENAAVINLAEALERQGAHVQLISQHTDQRRQRPTYRLEAAATVATGHGPSPLEEIQQFEPDIVHVHNLFPNYGRHWCHGLPYPLVATLHNFRPLCAAGTLYREGKVCRDCVDGSSINAVRHGCYRSKVGSIPLAIATRRPPRDPLLAAADGLIVLSELAKHEYVRAGVPTEKITVLRNFLPDGADRGSGPGGGPWLFVGRLDEAKGIVKLLEHWDPALPLDVAGAGPQERYVRQLCRDKISFLGPLEATEVADRMRTARGLVIPSLWLEGFPTVHIEAWAAACPVLAWKPSSSAAFIEEAGGGGLSASWDEDVRMVAHRASDLFPALRQESRQLFEREFSEDPVITRIARLYRQLIRQRGSTTTGIVS
jgi:glycosyltransferase involved in cell wall biosynthesis